METITVKVKGGLMAMDDRRSLIYFARSPKLYTFPDFTFVRKLEKAKNGNPYWSQDGQFLVTLGVEGWMEIYNTENYDKPLYRRHWPYLGLEECCVFHDHSVLIPVNDSVYEIDLSDSPRERLLYRASCEDQKGCSAKAQKGRNRITSITAHGNDVIICYQTPENEPDMAVHLNWERREITGQREIPYELTYHFSPQGELYSIRANEIRQHIAWDSPLDQPVREIKTADYIPATFSVFSPDGRYLSVWAVNACLIDTSSWTVVCETDSRVYRAVFSNMGKHWLVETWNGKYVITL